MQLTTQHQPEGIGFAGLGAMGLGMASNLVQAGFPVSGFDVFPKALENFAAKGGRPMRSLLDASRGQSKFFVMVATPGQVDGLVPDLTESLPQGAIFCLFSTLPPAYILELRGRLDAMGRPDIRLLDCPVSGGVVGANGGKLTIMMGGDDDTIAEVRPVLDVISAPGRLFSTGPLGSASTMKMLNQHLAGIHVVAAAETLAFAKALGLSSRESYKILLNSEGGSWIMGDRGLSMLSGDFSPKSAVTIFTKDMGIVNAAADDASLPCPIALAALQQFAERAARGYGRDDDASVVVNYEGVTGTSVVEPEDNGMTLTPDNSPSGKRRPVILIANKEQLATLLEKQTATTFSSRNEEGPKLRVVRETGTCLSATTLESIPDNALVGVSNKPALEALSKDISSKLPHVQIFDYEIIRGQDHKTIQILFSAQGNAIETALRGSIGTNFSPVPVGGPAGSASKMYAVIQLASLIHIAAAAECYSLAIAKNVSVDLLYNLISGAAGSSAQFNNIFPKMIQQDFSCTSPEGHDTISHAMENLKLVKKITEDIGFPARLLEATYQVFKQVNRNAIDAQYPTAALTLYWGGNWKESCKI